MDKSIERIIRRVLEEARAKGRDHLTQTELAVRAVREARSLTWPRISPDGLSTECTLT
jgi:hypothetical protein